MTNLDPEICHSIKEARRAAKLSQMIVAAEVGCKQSALSSFEQGDGTKLSDEVVEKLAKKFGIDISGMVHAFEKADTPFMDNLLKTCCARGGSTFFNETMPDG